MDVVFLLPVATDAYLRKRVKALGDLGIQPRLLAFEGDHPGKEPEVGYTSLGKLVRGNYHERIVPILRAVPAVHSAARDSDVIYAFGLNMLLIGWLANQALDRQVKIVYEVADIRGVLLEDGLFSSVMRWLERYLLQSVDLLVVTSKAYIDGYYKGIQGLTELQYQVIENKIDPSTFPQQVAVQKKEKGILRIGYFGLLRCSRSWEVLKTVTEEGHGRIRVYIRGVPRRLNGFEEEAEKTSYIEYGGPYVAPGDLPVMYRKVDMVWACYPYQGVEIGNWRWARTNRFYEACYFKKPMFVQCGTENCQAVTQLGIGLCLPLDNIQETVGRILEIGESEFCIWYQNLVNLSKDVYVYTDEHRRLVRSIESL